MALWALAPVIRLAAALGVIIAKPRRDLFARTFQKTPVAARAMRPIFIHQTALREIVCARSATIAGPPTDIIAAAALRM
jgi:hypothetical protein